MKNVANYNVIYYDILKQMVAKDLLPIEKGYMDSQGFATMASEGISHKDFEWSRNFIEQNYRKLRPEHRENTYTYLMGLLNYGLKNYDEALSLFAKVKADDFNLFVRIKVHLIRIYFEMEDYERVQSEVDSFRHHLKSNKKLPDIYMKRYVTFSSYMTKIITALNSEDLDRLHSIHEEIKAASVFEFRKWMIEQLGQILGEKNAFTKP
jgi:tetratricopeptide (TPR) repeat protein